MGKPRIIQKVSVNKRTKQLSVTIPRKKLKIQDPTIKFGEDLFVEIRLRKRVKRSDQK